MSDTTIIRGFSVDNFGFYKDEKPFYPLIAPSFNCFDSRYNTCTISLDLSKSASLDFSKEKKLAETVKNQGGKILWDLDFKLIEDAIDFRFEGFFNIFHQNLSVFLQELLEPYLTSSFGVNFFKGSLDCLDYFPWNTAAQSYFDEWLEDEMKPIKNSPDALFQKHLKRLFIMSSFSEYLHRFSSRIFDEVLSFVLFDVNAISGDSKQFQLLSKKRFNHIKLILTNHKIPISQITKNKGYPSFGFIGENPDQKNLYQTPVVGVCFPNDDQCSNETLQQFDKLFELLNNNKISYRIFPEYDGMHGWDGLEKMIVITKTLSHQGLRVLQGFNAAMGEIIYVDKPTYMFDEISIDQWIKTSG